jgi:glycosyltransferase involved in cell wall biosynthesis
MSDSVAFEQLRVLWLGTVQSERRMLRSTAATPAAKRWSQGFLDGIAANGVRYCHVGHEPARVWPYGPLWLQADAHDGEHPTVGVAFANLPGLRFRSLARAYCRAVAAAVRSFSPHLVISYNAEPYVASAARVALGMGVPWIPIVMDGDDQMLDQSWQWVSDAVQGSLGVAFLSHWAAVHCPLPNTFHMDGGISFREMGDRSDPAAPVVLYTGTKGPWGGVDLLLDAWRHVRHPEARLWLCGQGKHERLREASALDSRITDYGVVSEDRLQDLTEQAAVLVNPRPPSYPGNRLNFPSKVLEYLGTGKPVVTTRTVSLAPEYDNVLLFAVDDTPAAFAAAIDKVMHWSLEERSGYRRAVRQFAAEHGDWRAVSGRFLQWASGLMQRRDAPHDATCPSC